jgi:hypothetical protein
MAVSDTLKDAAYVTVGIGVLGFQKAQVRRVELTKQITEQVKTIEAQVAEGRKAVAGTVSGLADQIEGFVAPVRSQIETQLDTIEAALPTQVAELMKQARTVAHQTEDTVRKSLKTSA